jgi:hypothetical protein
MPPKSFNKNSRDSGVLRRRKLPVPVPARQPLIGPVQKPVGKSAVSRVKTGVGSSSKGLHKRKSKVGSVGVSRGLSSGKKSPLFSPSRGQDLLGLSVSDFMQMKTKPLLAFPVFCSPKVVRLRLRNDANHVLELKASRCCNVIKTLSHNRSFSKWSARMSRRPE